MQQWKYNLRNEWRDKAFRWRVYLTALLLAAVVAVRLATHLLAEKQSPPPITFLTYEDVPTVANTYTLHAFNPNHFTAENWAEIGFTARQAATILKYQELVGGTFESQEQLKKCYAISDEKFQEIQPYLLLPKKIDDNPTFNPKSANFSINKAFDPNALTVAQWQQMGFSPKQAAAIVKYKHFLGGTFRSKEDIKKCFVINDVAYAKMEPYIVLPRTALPRLPDQFPEKPSRPILSLAPFDPNALDAPGWQRLGFTEKQVAAILKYKNTVLRGRFSSVDDIKACFVISPEKFAQIAPYIRLTTVATSTPTTTTTTAKNAVQSSSPTITLSSLEINSASAAQLVAAGVPPKTAANIVGYRKQLGGFVSTSQLYEVFLIDRTEAERIAASIALDTSSIEKYTLLTAPESWLKTHPYFKYAADKILYYRISEKNEKKIWKMMNVKPEYEAKMRLYLR